MVSSTKDFSTVCGSTLVATNRCLCPAVFNSVNLFRCGGSIRLPDKDRTGYQLIFVSCFPSFLHSPVFVVVHLLAPFVLVYYGSSRVLICWLPLYLLCRFTAAALIVHGRLKFRQSSAANWTWFWILASGSALRPRNQFLHF
ncbi:hypothetical protein K438DRAFT_314150 [Mycena galopus ATCC 62051]|nr:hypothetical protein K438DRAFT_314150 [Mycena galopus ATCC 62051]